MVAHDALQDAAGQGQADAYHAAAEDPGDAHVPHDEPCVRLPVDERMEATGASCVLALAAGADMVRVHDVKPIARMCRMADFILGREAYHAQ